MLSARWLKYSCMSKENTTLSFYESLNKKELNSLIDIGWFIYNNFSDYICILTSGGLSIFNRQNLKVSVFCFSIFKGKRVLTYRKQISASAPVFYYEGDPFEQLDILMKDVCSYLANNVNASEQDDIKQKNKKNERTRFINQLTVHLNIQDYDDKYRYNNEVFDIFSFYLNKVIKSKEENKPNSAFLQSEKVSEETSISIMAQFFAEKIIDSLFFQKEFINKEELDTELIASSLEQMIKDGGFDFSKCKGLPRIALITSYFEIVDEISKYNFLFDYIR